MLNLNKELVEELIQDQTDKADKLECTETQKQEDIFGEVVKVKGERVIVEIFKSNSKEKSGEVLDAANPISAKSGYIVKLAYRKIGKKSDFLMLIMPPILCLIAGVIFSYSMVEHFNRKKPVATEDVMPIGVAVWLFVGLYFSYKYWRDVYGRGRQLTVVNIIAKFVRS